MASNEQTTNIQPIPIAQHTENVLVITAIHWKHLSKNWADAINPLSLINFYYE